MGFKMVLLSERSRPLVIEPWVVISPNAVVGRRTETVQAEVHVRVSKYTPMRRQIN